MAGRPNRGEQKEFKPYAEAAPQRLRMTSEIADAILTELEDSGDLFAEVCERHGVLRTSFSTWVAKYGTDEQRERKDAINRHRADVLEEKALDLALGETSMDGPEGFYKSKAVATQIGSLVNLANRIRPKANKTEVSGPEGGPITTHELSGLTDSERSSRITAILERAGARRAGQPPADDSGDL